MYQQQPHVLYVLMTRLGARARCGHLSPSSHPFEPCTVSRKLQPNMPNSFTGSRPSDDPSTSFTHYANSMTATLAEHEEGYETWFQDVLPILVRTP